MFIAIVDICCDPDDRPAVLAHLAAERSTVRAMPGCIDFRVLAAPDDDGRATVLHEWDDESSFGGYTTSASFARFGTAIRPLLIEPPVSRRFRAALAETVG